MVKYDVKGIKNPVIPRPHQSREGLVDVYHICIIDTGTKRKLLVSGPTTFKKCRRLNYKLNLPKLYQKKNTYLHGVDRRCYSISNGIC